MTRFSPGEAVFGALFERCGGFAEWVCAPERMLRKKPPEVSFEQAAAIPQSAAIAVQGLEMGQLEAGQHVAINGAGGGGGSFAVQLAKQMGARVTGIDSSEKQELLRGLGADDVIDYKAVDFTRHKGRYDMIFDLVGGHALSDFRRALSPGGRYVLVGGPMRLVIQVLTIGTLMSRLGTRKMGLLMLKTNEGLDSVLELMRSGAIRPVVDRTFPLAETPRALKRLGEGRANGKLVITVRRDEAG